MYKAWHWVLQMLVSSAAHGTTSPSFQLADHGTSQPPYPYKYAPHWFSFSGEP